MTSSQRIIKGFAIGLAVLIILSICNLIISIFVGFDFFFGDDNKTYDYNTYKVAEVTDVDISIGAASLYIKQGEEFKIEIPDFMEYEISNTKLYIKDPSKRIKNKKASITVSIPYDELLESLVINGGAGNIEIDTIAANEVIFKLGAGNVKIDKIDAYDKIKVDGGAGDFRIKSGTLANADIDMGIGNFDINASLSGRNSIEMGVGNLNIKLLDDIDNYTFDIDKGIGSATINGKSVSKGIIGNGDTLIKIDGGVGNIKIGE